ncbi:MAG: hypothetical protein LBQ51_05180 [Desulfovibrio sp.]|jgi:hypothetical protein|nr:hypothetical protein [Desulfovibrio sp.]
MSEGLTPWVCIARTGTFDDSQGRPHTFTEADLEAIRAGYDPTKSEAALVFGHPKDSDPAYGWVVALKREGAKLFARFARVPEKVRQLVQDGRYRYVSMSLSPDKKRLLHVGLLGAAAPAIDGLGPVALSADGITINFSAPGSGGAGGNMNPDELQKQISDLTIKLAAAQGEITSLKAALEAGAKDKAEADKKAEAAAAEFAAFKGKLADDARKARVRALVDSGRLAPAKETETLSFAAALADVQKPVSFAASDGKVEEISAEERYFRDLEARAPDPRFTNFATAAPAPGHAAQIAPDAVPADITNKL